MWPSAPLTIATPHIDFANIGADIRGRLVDVSEQQLARAARVLVQNEVVGLETSASVAARAIATLEKLTHHMARLVGEDGILAIFRRAIALSARRVSWLATARVPVDPPWEALRAAIGERATAEAIDGFAVLVADLVELLGRFIGDDLVARLMSEIWPGVFGPLSEEGK